MLQSEDRWDVVVWAQWTGVKVPRPVTHEFAVLNRLIEMSLLMRTLNETLLEMTCASWLDELLISKVLMLNTLDLHACPSIGCGHHVEAIGSTCRDAAAYHASSKLLTHRISWVEARRLDRWFGVKLKLPANAHLVDVLVRTIGLLALALTVRPADLVLLDAMVVYLEVWVDDASTVHPSHELLRGIRRESLIIIGTLGQVLIVL